MPINRFGILFLQSEIELAVNTLGWTVILLCGDFAVIYTVHRTCCALSCEGAAKTTAIGSARFTTGLLDNHDHLINLMFDSTGWVMIKEEM